jgi:metal-responsive CopG/Arc/MetJ family transcriptional regulator
MKIQVDIPDVLVRQVMAMSDPYDSFDEIVRNAIRIYINYLAEQEEEMIAEMGEIEGEEQEEILSAHASLRRKRKRKIGFIQEKKRGKKDESK